MVGVVNGPCDEFTLDERTADGIGAVGMVTGALTEFLDGHGPAKQVVDEAAQGFLVSCWDV